MDFSTNVAERDLLVAAQTFSALARYPDGLSPVPTQSPFSAWEQRPAHASSSSLGSGANPSTSLLFIDSGVTNVGELINAVSPGTEVHVLDSAQDAIAQITQVLLGHRDVSSLNIVSHGGAGSLQLGQTWLTLDTLKGYADQFALWQQSLTQDADLLLYGCNVAYGEAGQAFVQVLSQLTGADVAASSNSTGIAGDWDLEVTTGEIQSPFPFQSSILNDYAANLGPIQINEFRRAGNLSNSEYIEFLLTADQTAAQLESLYFGDSTATTTDKYGFYRFQNLSAIASTFKAGTIITIGGATAIPANDTVYNPTASGSNGDWNLALQVSGGYVTWSSNPNLGDFAASDVVWVDGSNTGTSSIHSIHWGPAPGPFGLAATLTLAYDPNDGTTGIVEFQGNSTQLTDPTQYGVNTVGSPGLPNGGANSTEITALRSLATGSFGSDFDGNGTRDLIWYDYRGGAVELWLMDGTGVLNRTNLPAVTYGSQLVGMADFDHNNQSDLLWWNHDTGETTVWLMNGPAIARTVNLPTFGGRSDWRISGIADFDHNGTPDILWRSKSQEKTEIWLLNGPSLAGGVSLPSRSRDWFIAGVTDVNHDGNVDILWRNAQTGGNEFTLLNQTSVSGAITLPNLPTSWVPYYLDRFYAGETDLLWRDSSTGAMAIWRLDATGNYAGSTNLTVPGSNGWFILDRQDLDKNGTVDLVVRNYVTGQNAIWNLNNGAYVSTTVAPTSAGLWDAIA